MTNKALPPDWENVMVTFDMIVERPYEPVRKERVTRMGFYSNLLGTFSVPPRWKEFNGTLLPDGFGGHHLKPERIVKWEPLKHQ